jgi:hypothetical protein
MLHCLEIDFLSLCACCVAVSSIRAAPSSNMSSTQADNHSRKFRLRCGCHFFGVPRSLYLNKVQSSGSSVLPKHRDSQFPPFQHLNDVNLNPNSFVTYTTYNKRTHKAKSRIFSNLQIIMLTKTNLLFQLYNHEDFKIT